MPESEDIFSTPESEARLDLIKHLIENSELVPLVRGMSGIGKSLLASRLQSGAPKNWAVCHFSADSMMQPERLLAQIARCNGLPDAKEDNIKRLVNRFETLRKRGTIPVLLIDDAQELPPTSLITLLRLYERQVSGAPLVSLVLFANEQIDMLLSTPQLQIMSPQSIQVIDLPPLTREEADTYMDYLLKIEGLDQGLALDESRMSRIYRETRGAPGPLAHAILEAFGEADAVSKPILGKLNQPLVWGAASLAVLLLLVLVFQESLNQLFTPDVPLPDERVANAEIAHEAEPSAQTNNKPQAQIVLPKPGAAGPAEVVDAPSVVQINPASEIERQPPDASSVVSEAVPETSVPEPVEHESASEPDGVTQETAVEPTPSTPNEDPTIEAPGQLAAKENPESEVMDEPVAAPDVPPAEQPESAVEVKISTKPTVLRSLEWVREQKPGSYTIQILAVENIESIQPVIDKHHLQGKAFSVRTERQGRAWYPLLLGEFPNRTAAVEAIKQLAPDLQKGGAWARSFASLQP
ncbi:MAG: SPOR domain-containing protein [Candidatus Thiodiazotropha sp.]